MRLISKKPTKKPRSSSPTDPEQLISQLKFRKKRFGGVDEADVWRKVNALNQLYQLVPDQAAFADGAENAIRAKRKHLINKKEVISFFLRLIALVLVIYVLAGVLFGLTVMPNNDMSPRISSGDVLLYYRVNYEPGNSDVVVLDVDGTEYVARIVARPGESVEIPVDGGLRVNGSVVIENDVFYSTYPYDNDISYPMTLASDEVFVLADRREGGKDSRYFGAVKLSQIQGEVICVVRRNSL